MGETGKRAVFRRLGGAGEGSVYLPTEHAEGPWGVGKLHGGAVAGLVAVGLEGASAAVPMRVARFTIDLIRAVPTAPLALDLAVLRESRRVQQLELTISADGDVVVRARAVRIRTAPELGAALAEEGVVSPPGEPGTVPAVGMDFPEDRKIVVPGFVRALDYVREPAEEASGRRVSWIRIGELVEGEAPSPLVRLAVAADFTSGSSVDLDFMKWMFVNPDISVSVAREPVGEWISVASESHLEPDGIGSSNAILSDATGPIARAQTSMVVDRRR